MKKTLIALIALAGVASAFDTQFTDVVTEDVWSIDFGSELTTQTGSTNNGYNITGTIAKQGTFWDVVAVEGGTQTKKDKRVHMAGGEYGKWSDNFQVTITLTLGETISASNNWPVFAEIAGNGTSLRFGPYTAVSNTVAIDGTNLTKGPNNIESVTAKGTHTITLIKYGSDVILYVDGKQTGEGVLANSVSGNITDIALGGNTGSSYRINSTVHSITWSKVTSANVIPEPATATLSLLALCGLAARRRRR